MDLKLIKNDLSSAPDFLFEGYLFGYPSDAYSKLVRDGISARGISFIEELNGSFCGVIRLGEELIIFNDRYGSRRLYFSVSHEVAMFDSDFNRLVNSISHATVDELGVYEFFTFGYPLFERTLISEISYYPPATITSINLRSFELKRVRYWDYRYTYVDHGARAEKLLFERFENAVYKASVDDTVYLVGNSGGLDSRSILYFMAQAHRKMRPYFVGAIPSDGSHVATRISKNLGLTTQLIEVPGNYLSNFSEAHMRYCPLISLECAWNYAAFASYRAPGDAINLNGILSSPILGDLLKEKEYYRGTVPELVFKKNSVLRNSNLSPSICSRFRAESILEHVAASFDYQEEVWDTLDIFGYKVRQMKFINDSAFVSCYGKIPSRSPLLENEFVDFCLTLAYEQRYHRALHMRTVALLMPAVADIRLERSYVTPRDGKLTRWARTHLGQAVDFLMSRLVGHKVIVKNTHKPTSEWIKGDWQFLIAVLEKENDLFRSFFNHSFILENLSLLLEKERPALMNLLTIKLWMDKNMERIHA